MAVNAFNLIAKSSKMRAGPTSFHSTTFSDYFSLLFWIIPQNGHRQTGVHIPSTICRPFVDVFSNLNLIKKLNDKTLEFLPAVFGFRSPSSFFGPYGHRASSCGCRYRHNSLMQKTQWYYKENVYINFNILKIAPLK